MTCDNHAVENVEIVEIDGTVVTIEATCSTCSCQLWTTTNLEPVADVSVGDRFRDSDGQVWEVSDPIRPGRIDCSGNTMADVDDPTEDRTVGVSIETHDQSLWFSRDHFNRIRDKIFEEIDR